MISFDKLAISDKNANLVLTRFFYYMQELLKRNNNYF